MKTETRERLIDRLTRALTAIQTRYAVAPGNYDREYISVETALGVLLHPQSDADAVNRASRVAYRYLPI